MSVRVVRRTRPQHKVLAADSRVSDTHPTVTIAAPTVSTRAAIWRLAHETDNSNAYLLWLADYFDQSLIAWINGQLAGFVVAGELRSGSGTARILDIAVSASVRRSLVVPPLLDQLVTKLIGRGLSHIEASLKTTDSELATDLRSLTERWRTKLVVADDPTGGVRGVSTVTVGPLHPRSG